MKKIWVFLAIMVVSAVLGSLTGRVIQGVFPDGGMFHNFFGAEERVGFFPATVDLVIFELTLGFIMKFTLMSVLFMIAAAYLFFALKRRKKAQEPPNDSDGQNPAAE